MFAPIRNQQPEVRNSATLPWFSAGQFPLYLAPMAGVSDKIFRQLCKERGADVLVTEFVSAEGVFRRNERTREYLDFDECERPLGVQLFGGNAEHMAEAGRHVIDWVRPDFIDLNFGCPVNKVVAKNGGSALLKDCPTLAAVARAVVRACNPIPVTAKIRIGWDDDSINAPSVARILEDARYCRDCSPRPHACAGIFRQRGLGRHRSSRASRLAADHWQWRYSECERRGAASRGDGNCGRHDWPCGDERSLDFRANKTRARDRRNVAAAGFAAAMGPDSTALPARRR